MKYKKQIAIGLIAISLFYVNKFMVTNIIEFATRNHLSNLTQEQLIIALITNKINNQLTISYYSLIYEVMFYVYLIEAILIYVFSHSQINKRFKAILSNFKLYIKKVGQYIIIMVTLITGAYLIMYLIGVDLLMVGDNQSMINVVLLNNPNPYVFLTVMLIAPLIEEFIFRYGLTGNLLKPLPNILRVIIGALVFSFIHIGLSQLGFGLSTTIQLLLMYLPMALIYNIAYIREKNIIYPLSLHIINNIGSIIFVYVINYFI